jgi:hypothetical protein
MATPSLAQNSTDRRRSIRFDMAFCPLQIDPCNGWDPIPCSVCDMSETGARLKVPCEVLVPSVIALLIGNVKHFARIAWRSDHHMGVEFIDL